MIKLIRKVLRRVEVTLLYFMGKMRGIFQEKKYHIKRGYKHRRESIFFDDTSLTDECQKEVYELAHYYCEKDGFRNVLDIGCGSGYKLMKYFKEFNTIGSDIETTFQYLQEKYPDRKWINAAEKGNHPLATDVIICADVIEHLVRPEELIDLIKEIDFKLLFISTPERSMVRGWYDYGPPHNVCHVREWNAKEFRNYISSHFDIISHQITHIDDGTQLIICRKHEVGGRR